MGDVGIMKLEVINIEFSICKLRDISEVNFDDEFLFLGKTDEELSLVCDSASAPQDCLERVDGWSAFRIAGVLDFSLTGILSKISSILAEKRIGIFAVSTFNTDYILVKKEELQKAAAALESEGYSFVNNGE
jgi:hypothetical protein